MKRLKWKRRLLSCASVGMMLALTGCFGASKGVPAYGQPTQPPYLYLEANQPYIPVKAEKWVSPQILKEKDQQIMDQSELLNKVGLAPYLPSVSTRPPAN